MVSAFCSFFLVVVWHVVSALRTYLTCGWCVLQLLPKNRVRVKRSKISESVLRLNEPQQSDDDDDEQHGDDESSIADAETGACQLRVYTNKSALSQAA